MASSPTHLMSFYTAYLRALYLVHQNNHWKCRGSNFYGNHLLLERLYEATQESVDAAAEKTVGLYGELEDMSPVIKSTVDKYSPDKYGGDAIKASLEAEKMFLEISKGVYNELKGGALTLGLDDFLMSQASKHELHVYLLEQTAQPTGSMSREAQAEQFVPWPERKPEEPTPETRGIPHGLEAGEMRDALDDAMLNLYAVKDALDQGDHEEVMNRINAAITDVGAARDQAEGIAAELMKAR